jgi:hypothetical protein
VAQNEIPKEVLAFLADHISSVVELEALLLLHGTAGRTWTAGEIARELRIDAAWPATQLQGLCAKGIIACATGSQAVYTFDPKRAEVRSTVDALARAYADRRVTVIGLIFSKPVDKLKRFSDAFRIRKDPE